MRDTQPRLMVACGIICEQDSKILMVKEYRPNEGLVLNQPVGKLELGEDIFQGTLRETHEETGLEVELTHFLGAYVWLIENGNTSIRFCFIAKVVGGELRNEPHNDDEIVEPVWLSIAELYSQQVRFRNIVTRRCLDDYLNGKKYPLEIVQTLR